MKTTRTRRQVQGGHAGCVLPASSIVKPEPFRVFMGKVMDTVESEEARRDRVAYAFWDGLEASDRFTCYIALSEYMGRH